MFNYEESQLKRLEPADHYMVKVRTDSGETKWILVLPEAFARIRAILVEEGRKDAEAASRVDMARARKLDGLLRWIADETPYEFDRHKESAPVGSELWHDWAGDVLAAAHNKRVITMDRRNELLQELYVVWTGDTSSDSE